MIRLLQNLCLKLHLDESFCPNSVSYQDQLSTVRAQSLYTCSPTCLSQKVLHKSKTFASFHNMSQAIMSLECAFSKQHCVASGGVKKNSTHLNGAVSVSKPQNSGLPRSGILHLQNVLYPFRRSMFTKTSHYFFV